ncbi:hypothetical protein ACFLU5_05585 [Bacteroidota bacterium]
MKGKSFLFFLLLLPFTINAQKHVFSTSVKAQEIKALFEDDERLDAAVEWCRTNGIEKIYLETFRFGYLVEGPLLRRVKQRFEAAGIKTAGLVTPTMIAKPSTGWNAVCCYTDEETQKRTRNIFEFTAKHFDIILIDDFWFTDCKCNACDSARKAKQVTVEGETYPVTDTGWGSYRRELMARLAEKCVISTCRDVNSRSCVILKFPCWYDTYQDRGYDPIRAIRLFDAIWVGTETRDYNWKDKKGRPQPAAFFLMGWLLSVGGEKCEGAWFDPLWTTPATYVEQARFSILGGAKESLLHSYGYLTLTEDEGRKLANDDVVAKKKLKGVGGMGTPNGKADFEALMREMPRLQELAEETAKRKLTGIAAYKPVNSNGGEDSGYFNLLGMTGLPLLPCSEFTQDAPAACFTGYALEIPDAVVHINDYIETGRPTLISGYLAKTLGNKLYLSASNVMVLPTEKSPWHLLDMSQEQLQALHTMVLKPLGITKYKAPNHVGMVLFTDGSYVLSNFQNTPVTVTKGSTVHTIPPRGFISKWTD